MDTPSPSNSGNTILRIDLDKASPDTVRIESLPMGTLHQDGQTVTMISSNGARHEIDANGNITGHIPVLRRMEIADLTQVVGHSINRVHQTTSHVIHFVGGGVFTVVYDHQGGPVEMTGRNVRKSTSVDGVVTLYGTYAPEAC